MKRLKEGEEHGWGCGLGVLSEVLHHRLIGFPGHRLSASPAQTPQVLTTALYPLGHWSLHLSSSRQAATSVPSPKVFLLGHRAPGLGYNNLYLGGPSPSTEPLPTSLAEASLSPPELSCCLPAAYP